MVFHTYLDTLHFESVRENYAVKNVKNLYLSHKTEILLINIAPETSSFVVFHDAEFCSKRSGRSCHSPSLVVC
jgi:hypothetical protein